MGMGTRMGMYDSIPKVQDWEGDDIDPFPKLGNEKGMKRIILSRFFNSFVSPVCQLANSITGRE